METAAHRRIDGARRIAGQDDALASISRIGHRNRRDQGLRIRVTRIGEEIISRRDFDNLTERTKLLHNTKRWNQPWKTGLPVDFTPADKTRRFAPLGWLRRARESLLGRYAMLGAYKPHWDPSQERFFFGLLRECLEQGLISETMLREEMARNHVRHDAFEVMERTPPLAA